MLITDQPANEYHGDTQHNTSSMLKLLATKTPAHLWARYLDPQREPFIPTPAMRFGTAVHTACLEPWKFDDQYTVMPEGLDRRTKEGKALYAEIEASGKAVLSHDDMTKLRKIQASVLANPWFASVVALEPIIEGTIIVGDRKIRTDLMLAPCEAFPRGLIIDLKSTTDANPAVFGRQSHNLGYLIQVAYYCDVYAEHYGSVPEFVLLPVETSLPFLTAPYSLDAEQIYIGQQQYKPLLEMLRQCRATNTWPGYAPTPKPLELPNWAYSQFEDELAVSTED